jgi:hypothetical protein
MEKLIWNPSKVYSQVGAVPSGILISSNLII